jgi:phage baseplate assembly protein W
MANSINIKFPLQRSPKGAFETNDSTIDAVADDLRILLLTNYGERPIHYDFGANLRELIFLQGNSVGDSVRDAIIVAVEKWMPFVTLDDIQVFNSTTDSTLSANVIRVKILFSVSGLQGILVQEIRA